MHIKNFILDFPELKRKDELYYLYLGVIYGLSSDEIYDIVINCLEQDVLKRKILLNKIMNSVSKWSKDSSDNIFNKVYISKDSLSSYFKKESASMILMSLFPYISRKNQKKLSNNLLQSKYKNNRKRIYKYLYENWSPGCEKIIEKAWSDFQDEELIRLLISKMSEEFLLKNFSEISDYFNEDELTYDFFLKILRNNFYIRLHNHIKKYIEQLKDSDPISFIFIKKELGEKLEIPWAIKIYENNSRSRFLARWYSEMGLWEEILTIEPNLLFKLNSNDVK